MNRAHRYLVAWSVVATLSLVPGLAFSQQGRVRAMGGLTLALHDSDYTLNPYDFAGNPAWLIEDERTSWLKFLPAAGGEWGDLHRRYDPGSVVTFGAAFDGVKTLDEKGTFRGMASYDVETRRDVYRSLKRQPYGGEAFFVTDTMTGNFTYAGPTVRFLYSYEPFSGIAVGASVRYQIQKGLKDTYSRVSSLYRDLQARLGATIKAGDAWVFGATIEPWDNQESMEAKSEESFEVELFNYRGDTFATRQRGSSIDHKVRKKGVDFTGEAFYRPGDGVEVGLLGSYGKGRTQILVPKATEEEAEEGIAPSRRWNARLQGRFDCADGVTLGGMLRLGSTRSWSEHSALGLLLWDWSINEIGAGVGVTARVLPGLLAGLEFEFVRTTFDSLKYIDGNYRSDHPSQYHLRCGVEYAATDAILLRLGGLYRTAGVDLTTGVLQLDGFGVTAGAGARFTPTILLDFFIEYGSAAPRNAAGLHRAHTAGGLQLTLLSP